LNAAASDRRVALVLSGGGVRAMLFHLGVMRHLAEVGMLRWVSRVSTVSGGSLLTGLMLQETNLRWPTDSEFLTIVYPSLRRKLCERSLQWGAARQLLRPWNWRFLLSRSNLLALALQKEWNVAGRLADLHSAPEWSINGTTAETGRRFRFKRDSIGDYTLGYAGTGNFPLAGALAVSAAFPGGFGPLTLDATRFDWQKRHSWDDPSESAQAVKLEHQRLHLYDGGVYDNLGLEPFFDAGRGVPKHEGDFILIADAGARLPTGFDAWALNPWRLKRVADIMSEQARALRVRTFTHYLQQQADRGAYVYIGEPAQPAEMLSGRHPAEFPTTLRRVSTDEFDAIAGHGLRVARHALPTAGASSRRYALDV
jgi:NTE family protein